LISALRFLTPTRERGAVNTGAVLSLNFEEQKPPALGWLIPA